MIDKLKYEQVALISSELKKEATIVQELAQKKNAQELIDFATTVEGYSKFLENYIEINKDADKVLSELMSTIK